MKDKSLVPLLDKFGFDGTWEKYFSGYTLEGLDTEKEGCLQLYWETNDDMNFAYAKNYSCPNITFNSGDLLTYAKKHGLYFAQLLDKYNMPYKPLSESTAVSYSWQRDLIEVLS